MSSLDKDHIKRKRKESKRRDANAIERRRIKEFNDALRRLREVTKHITIDNKKKGRKITKLTTIRAAIKHIKNLESALDMADVNDSSINNVTIEDDAQLHDSSSENEIKTPEVDDKDPTWTDTHDGTPLEILVPTLPLEQVTPKPEPPSELISVNKDAKKYEDINLSQLYADTMEGNMDIKAENNDFAVTESEEELVGEVYNQDYLLVDDNGEYKVVTIEQRFALPHLLYLEGWRSGESGTNLYDHIGTV